MAIIEKKDETKPPAAVRIAALIGSMPYGALASTRAGLGHAKAVVKYDRAAFERDARATVDLDVLADWLEALRSVLEDHAGTTIVTERRMYEAEAQLRAIGETLLQALPAAQRRKLMPASSDERPALLGLLRAAEPLCAKLRGTPGAQRRAADLEKAVAAAKAAVGEG